MNTHACMHVHSCCKYYSDCSVDTLAILVIECAFYNTIVTVHHNYRVFLFIILGFSDFHEG